VTALLDKRIILTAYNKIVSLVEKAENSEIEKVQAISSVDAQDLLDVLFSAADEKETGPVASGIAASPGAATGKLCLSVDAVLDTVDAGQEAIMIAMETGPEDEPGMRWSSGIATAHGGLASHAAIYSRGLGLPAVCGITELEVRGSSIVIGDVTINEGEEISINGTTGEIYSGELEISEAEAPAELDSLLNWCDQARNDFLGVRANADTAEEAAEGVKAGADGIGLCRTEHMFLGERLPVIRKVLQAKTTADQESALSELIEIQTQDFVSVLEPMDSKPVTIRLLDAPLHEFLEDSHEQNPMLGLRGIRLALVTENLYRAQTRAVISAVKQRLKASGDPIVEIMVPLISIKEELETILSWIREETTESPINIPLGTMIETPRAALIAGDLAQLVDFLSFGTNDLTQMTYGFSRDDVEATVIQKYIEMGILNESPFAELDIFGVGELIQQAISRSKETNPKIKIGICGEHGGDPNSIRFLVKAGVNYVSCSPPRIPIARLVGAQEVTK
jgi:pyruvate,orthophosphate dikinase